MSQTRLYFTGTKAQAGQVYAALEQEFEEDGLPLAIIELDETRDIHEVSVYAEGAISEIEQRIRTRLGAGFRPTAWERESLPDIDWVSRSLEGLKPVRVGRILVHGSHDRDKRRVGDLAIEVEAGLAFGTGHHGTTAGCLEMIEAVLRRERPQNALDLGTGSGVLAIALAKLGIRQVLATDIDPVATQVARENARKNGVGQSVRLLTATGFRHEALRKGGPFALIVANILARPLMELAPTMARHIEPGGSVILSGILDSQRDRVLAAYVGQGFRHMRTLHREGWSTIWLKR